MLLWELNEIHTGWRWLAWLQGCRDSTQEVGMFVIYVIITLLPGWAQLMFTSLGILAHNPAVCNSTWHIPSMASEDLETASLVFPFSVLSTQDCFCHCSTKMPYKFTTTVWQPRWAVHTAVSIPQLHLFIDLSRLASPPIGLLRILLLSSPRSSTFASPMGTFF